MAEVRTQSVIGVIGTDCTGSYKSNYHTITARTAPKKSKCKYYNKLPNTHILFQPIITNVYRRLTTDGDIPLEMKPKNEIKKINLKMTVQIKVKC